MIECVLLSGLFVAANMAPLAGMVTARTGSKSPTASSRLGEGFLVIARPGSCPIMCPFGSIAFPLTTRWARLFRFNAVLGADQQAGPRIGFHLASDIASDCPRAILLASATATTGTGLRSSIRA